MNQVFRRYSRYLKERYGQSVYRLGIDAGFGCPNRDADGNGGCFYCDGAGARAAYQEKGDHARYRHPLYGPDPENPQWQAWMKRQIEGGMDFLRRRYKTELFILYIQAFSGTAAPPERLRRIYDYLLSFAPFREFIIGTRPDCLDGEKIDLLASYQNDEREIWLELGLQSYHDRTLERIGRGHDTACFEEAFHRAREAGLRIAVHLIFGLPGESDDDMAESVRRLSRLKPDGVKFHNLNIAEDTEFARLWREGSLEVADSRTHLQRLVRAIELLPPRTIIQRLSCDTPSARLLAPRDFIKKSALYQALEKELQARGSFQGSSFND